MQPNGNMPGAGRPVAGAPVGNVNATPMPAGPTFDNGPSVVKEKGDKKTGWILAVVLLLIIAAGGVGFGVWVMMDGNAQKDALNSQISNLKQQNNDLQDKLDNGGDTIINIDADGNEVNTADYIYVGEWGIKIRKPENWRATMGKYTFYNDYPQAVDTLDIRENDSDEGGVLISVGGDSCETLISVYSACFEVDDKVIVAEELTSQASDNITSDEFKDYFMNAENYSKI